MHTYTRTGGTLALAALASFVACTADHAGGTLPIDQEGYLRLELTDAPIDDETIAGVYVTVAEVRLDGEVQAELSRRTTLDIASFHDGETFRLGANQAVAADAHGDLEFVFDLATDAEGNAPGCYVLHTDGTKDALAFGGASKITFGVDGAFTVGEGEVKRLIVDLDLRKAVRRDEADRNDLTFASTENLRASARLVENDAAGSIEGQVTGHHAIDGSDAGEPGEEGDDDVEGGDDRDDSPQRERHFLIAYLYAAGGYDSEAAVAVEFEDAVTSARVGAGGRFVFPFVEGGAYELVVAEYQYAEDFTSSEFEQMLPADPLLNLLSREVLVSGKATVEVAVELKL